MFLKGLCYAESETTTFKSPQPQTPNALQGFRSKYLGMSELPRAETHTPGLPELRFL